MSLENSVTIPALPMPLRWRGVPAKWHPDTDSVLTFSAGQQTDWFIDPEGTVTILNAPALLMRVQQPCLLRAHVTVDAAATYDAGVLAVYQSDEVWAKVCLELSPQGQLMVVSVVTRGTSDDCNSVPVIGQSIYLRVAKLERAYAFHYSLDGRGWHLVRYFRLGESPEVEIGFLVQSPIGDGCTASFSDISYLPQKLNNIRSGE
jgi:uncharacterized protein